ncbi:flippase-like domain-containing protein [Adhaeribacter sp. BT258]|uniref:Flippase-like domain-containing protein n=1 Tax=Adhaeribacter terrigena TaxID=2793070 RepID=A0ABS1BZJ0_9BACT|nr:lysylphosphatidylglycerol synthase transmembrane domain-containing protein [Adhaeribacter terrigena]MBK0402582.1 flippase-like domain-containing protein [Adhaeribacter terrigena]
MTVVLKNKGWLALKLLVFGLTSFYLYRAVQGRTDWFALLQEHDNARLRLLVFMAAMLIPVNWGLEAWKWWYLARKIETVSFLRAFRSVMVGLTLGFITPNRVGDYAGRILELRSRRRIHAIGAIFLGRFAQLVVTVLAGSVGGFYLFWHFYWPEFPWAKVSVGLFLLAGNAFCLLFFFRSTLILAMLATFPPARRFLPYLRVLARYNFAELGYTLLLAASRYAVFGLQFGLLLNAFGVQLSILKYVSGISSTFLLKSIVPSFSALTDIGMREVSAMHFFSLFGEPELNVLSASLSLWFLNIVVPSAIGLIFVARLKFKKGTE